MSTKKEYHPIIKTQIDKLQKQIKDARQFNDLANLIDKEIITEFGKSLQAELKYIGDSLDVKVWISDVKDLLPLRRILARNGFKVHTELSNDPEHNRVVMSFINKDVGYKGKSELWIWGYFISDSVCHYEEVGTKETPVYELVCE